MTLSARPSASNRRKGRKADAGVTPDAWLRNLYQELLRRAPSATELDEWVAAMAGGVSRDEVRAIFLDSPEYHEVAAQEQGKAAIAATGLFDGAWYAATYRDVAVARVDPLEHYCRHGCFQARSPNAYFDEAWYRERANIPADAMALVDYADRGEANDVPPSRHFDPAWYRRAYDLPPGMSPLAHFLRHRRESPVAPSAMLWSFAYTEPAADIPGGGDRFQQFLASHTAADDAIAHEIDLIRASGLLDENHYQIANEDVFDAKADPVEHYCKFGWQEWRSPNFYFNARWYIETNPDVARLGVNPLLHYLLVGEPADRRPVVYFEPGWYREKYALPPDASPLAHYLANRRSQQFSPNSLFDPAWYLTQTRMHRRRDPFAHYLVAGMRQDLQPSASFDAAAWRRHMQESTPSVPAEAQHPERDNPLVNYLLTNYR